MMPDRVELLQAEMPHERKLHWQMNGIHGYGAASTTSVATVLWASDTMEKCS